MAVLRAWLLVGLPLLGLGLVYLLGPEPGLFGFGEKGGPLYWLTGLALVGSGLALSTMSLWWHGKAGPPANEAP